MTSRTWNTVQRILKKMGTTVPLLCLLVGWAYLF
jgi:cbb3-type cytochrome oxidase subunit 3